MARLALTAVLLFALPFVVYALYVGLRGSKATARRGVMDRAPVRALIVIGVLVEVAGLIGFAILTQSGPSYEPPVGRPAAIEQPAAPTR